MALEQPIAGQAEAAADLEAQPALIDLRDRGQFLHVLEMLKCSLALSRRPSGVALLGVTDGVPTLAACLLPRTMGLAVGGNRLAIATTQGVTLFANEPTLAPLYPAKPEHYDAIFVPRMSFHTAYCDLHDMAFDKNILLAVNTRFNCISVIDGFFNFTPIWQPPFITDFAPDDRCHLNGMAFAEGKVQFVTMLGRSNEAGGWREHMAAGGLLMEVATGRVLGILEFQTGADEIFDLQVLPTIRRGKSSRPSCGSSSLRS